MVLKTIITFIASIIVFIGTGVLIIVGVNYIWPGYSFDDHLLERFFMLFICFMVSSMVYDMIKGGKSAIKRSKGVTSD